MPYFMSFLSQGELKVKAVSFHQHLASECSLRSSWDFMAVAQHMPHNFAQGIRLMAGTKGIREEPQPCLYFWSCLMAQLSQSLIDWPCSEGSWVSMRLSCVPSGGFPMGGWAVGSREWHLDHLTSLLNLQEAAFIVDGVFLVISFTLAITVSLAWKFWERVVTFRPNSSL